MPEQKAAGGKYARYNGRRIWVESVDLTGGTAEIRDVGTADKSLHTVPLDEINWFCGVQPRRS